MRCISALIDQQKRLNDSVTGPGAGQRCRLDCKSEHSIPRQMKSRTSRVALVVVALVPTAAPVPWSCQVGSAVLSVGADLSYNVSDNGQNLFIDGDVGVHYGGPLTGRWLTRRGGDLLPQSISPSNGTDTSLGRYASLAVVWGSDLTGFAFQTTFICYPDAGAIVFNSTWPLGAAREAGIDTYSCCPSGTFDNFNISYQPVSYFPSFDGSAAFADWAHIEWAGEFSWHYNNFGTGSSGFSGGQLGGPVAFASPTWEGGKPPVAVVVGPISEFKSSILGIVDDVVSPAGNKRWVFGPHGQLTTLPAGFTASLAIVVPTAASQFSVFPNDTGITAAVYQYGATLRAIHNTTRFQPQDDVGVSMLSYWSDNGQIYDGDYWTQGDTPGTGGGVFLALAASFNNASVPVQSYQLDPYWFASSGAGNGNWTPSASVFGANGSGFYDMVSGGLRTTLYSFFWAEPPYNTFTQYQWAVSPKMNNFVGGPIARIMPQDSFAFYNELMQRCRGWKCVGFEIDFLDFNYLSFQDSATASGVFEGVMQGLSEAGAQAGVPVQLCMPLPSDVLLSVQLRGVSNIRVSDDNDLTYASGDRWRIGLTSLLHGAVDIRPFFDGTWTHNQYTGADAHDVPYPAGYAQNATELGMAISLLSTGPVGIGDKLGFTNASLAMMTCASNGVLLKPSLPASPIDRYFNYPQGISPSLMQSSGAEIWQAPSFISISGSLDALLRKANPDGLQRYVHAAEEREAGWRPGSSAASASPAHSLAATFPTITPCPFVSILAVEVGPQLNVSLFPGDLTPSIDLNGTSASTCAASGLVSAYVAVPWSPGIQAMDKRCDDGAAALDCVIPLTSGGLTISTGNSNNVRAAGAYHPFELYSLSPVLANGYALLGELTKFNRASPVRFPAVAAGGSAQQPSLSFLVEGAANEVVDVAVLVPPSSMPHVTTNVDDDGVGGSAIKRVPLAFGSHGGSTLVTCIGSGVAAACSETAMRAAVPTHE